MDEAARERLRAGGIDELVDLLLEDVLDRPVDELVEPRWLATRLAEAARTAAADPQVETFLRDRVREARARVPARWSIAPELRRPLGELVGRPYVPDRVLVGRLLDHDTARLLLKGLFTDLLVAFGRKLRPNVPLPTRSPLPSLRGLQKLGENVLGVVGQELEQQVEQRAREFMDAGVQRLVEKLADQLCDPSLVREYGAWREHMLTTVLATEPRLLAGELEKLDPDSLVATGAALVRGIADRPELVGELEAVLRAAMDAAEGRSIRALLGGIDTHGLGLVRELLIQRARALVETERFAHWWDRVVEGR